MKPKCVLSEHRELRQVLGLASAPDFTTLYRFLQRLDDQTIDRAVGETVRRSRGSLRQGRKRTRVAVDATGFAQGAVRTFFVRRMHHHGQNPLPCSQWLQWVVAVMIHAPQQSSCLSHLAPTAAPWNDCAPACLPWRSEPRNRFRFANARSMVWSSSRLQSSIQRREIGYLSIRKQLGAQSRRFPLKRTSANERSSLRARSAAQRMRRAFPQLDLPSPRPDRTPVLFGETEALARDTGSIAGKRQESDFGHRASLPRIEIPRQSGHYRPLRNIRIDLVCLEDVNRAR